MCALIIFKNSIPLLKTFKKYFEIKLLEKSNQVLSKMKKINNISLNNFLEIQIHDEKFISSNCFCINAYQP